MTTETVQHEEIAKREPLPPGEFDAAPQALVEEHVAVAAPARVVPAYETKADPNDPPGATAKSIAHWIHKHPEAHKHGKGLLAYQYGRSFLASIPYGLSMAGVLMGFTAMERAGGKLAEKEGASALAKGFGRNLKGFASFAPARSAVLIGASFTLYRGTSKLGKWMTEYLFNPKDSEQRTAEKVDDLPQEVWRKVKEIAPAEVSSTPVSAIVLGFIVNAFAKPSPEKLKTTINGVERSFDWTRANFKSLPDWGTKLKVMGKAIIHPNASFVKHSIINTFGYALFFEMGDRLYKDVQIRRGVWPGEHNSIKALKAAPDEYAQGIMASVDTQDKPKYADSALAPVKEKHHYSFFTSEPGVGRFLFRRVLPTAVGITLYTGAKMRWGNMFGNNFQYAEGKMAPQFIGKAWGEGLATSLFFLIPIVSEPWEKIYDNFFANKENKAQLKDHPELGTFKHLNAHQVQKQEELLARVNEKEKAANDPYYKLAANGR